MKTDFVSCPNIPSHYTPFYTIDPGFNTAVCLWNGNKLEYNYFSAPTSMVHDSIVSKIEYLTKCMKFLIYPEARVFLESVQIHANSAKSMASAGQGYLTGLCQLTGAYIYQLRREQCAEVNLLLPSVWKGQMSDKVLTQRIARIIDYKFPNEHVRAAVGMGLHILKIL